MVLLIYIYTFRYMVIHHSTTRRYTLKESLFSIFQLPKLSNKSGTGGSLSLHAEILCGLRLLIQCLSAILLTTMLLDSYLLFDYSTSARKADRLIVNFQPSFHSFKLKPPAPKQNIASAFFPHLQCIPQILPTKSPQLIALSQTPTPAGSRCKSNNLSDQEIRQATYRFSPFHLQLKSQSPSLIPSLRGREVLVFIVKC